MSRRTSFTERLEKRSLFVHFVTFDSPVLIHNTYYIVNAVGSVVDNIALFSKVFLQRSFYWVSYITEQGAAASAGRVLRQEVLYIEHQVLTRTM